MSFEGPDIILIRYPAIGKISLRYLLLWVEVPSDSRFTEILLWLSKKLPVTVLGCNPEVICSTKWAILESVVSFYPWVGIARDPEVLTQETSLGVLTLGNGTKAESFSILVLVEREGEEEVLSEEVSQIKRMHTDKILFHLRSDIRDWTEVEQTIESLGMVAEHVQICYHSWEVLESIVDATRR